MRVTACSQQLTFADNLPDMAIHLSGGSGYLVVLAVLFVPATIAAYLLNDPKWLIIIPVGIVALTLAVAALPIRRKVTPKQWALELEPHLLGTDGTWDWDDATSVALADPRLEAIRGANSRSLTC
jgi:hypothetical protein